MKRVAPLDEKLSILAVIAATTMAAQPAN